MFHALYLHIPFCKHRCAYCDFNTYAGREALIPAYVEALCREIEIVGRQMAAWNVHTVFFGGGTPSLLTVHQFSAILAALQTRFDIQADAEISLEANPGMVSLEMLRGLRALGFNRISFGAQSFHADELRLLERIHDVGDIFDAFDQARRAGFENLNLDLIYGLPGQPLDRWSASLRQAVALAPQHLSLYALTVEPSTLLGRQAARGLLPLPDPDAVAEMYEWAGEYLTAHGYVQYEISNWARTRDESGRRKDDISPPSFACRHNLTYWRARPYLGFGAGAHGYVNSVRYSNVLRIKTYIERLTSHGLRITPFSPVVVNRHLLSRREEMQERMMLGLRLTREGVSARDFADRFGVEMMDAFGKEIAELINLGLLEWACGQTSEVSETSEVLRLTPHARLVGNQVFMRFVD